VEKAFAVWLDARKAVHALESASNLHWRCPQQPGRLELKCLFTFAFKLIC